MERRRFSAKRREEERREAAEEMAVSRVWETRVRGFTSVVGSVSRKVE